MMFTNTLLFDCDAWYKPVSASKLPNTDIFHPMSQEFNLAKGIPGFHHSKPDPLL